MALSLTLRVETERDLSFLSELYASTRYEELQATGWSEIQIDEFLDMQFKAQRTFYQQQFPDAKFQILVCDGEDAGRLYLDYRQDEIRIIDIALLPQYRGKGLGSRLLNSVVDEAGAKQLNVRIHVEKNNPALSLYQRLGFKEIEDKGVYWLMEKAAKEFAA